ncbi:small-conductance mechanosensitive channel/CRP-like cAMP-binding protein [Phyllobacterium sp. 1468]|uniref:mechanosensitive ion channel family protein n=1 Tax=Phyllobacterium sp. 1468 TaxID=2817759 RepID=UPI002860D3EC|nr:mechanosensitive ion channel family protein [Phyllobacterium sp. 1468]MDR6635111.1 small-conductance mechanosensitive channel/CRP-like cAMP-binding protein [Phyllobacterium sp. 1468]
MNSLWLAEINAVNPTYQFTTLVVLILAARALTLGRPALRFIAHITFFGLLTMVLAADGIAPWVQDSDSGGFARQLFVGLAKATWWIGGAMVLISSVRLFLKLELKPREGRLLQDLLVAIIYLGAGLSVIAYVFKLPVGTLIATSGVLAIVLGLALQNTLSDVFSGIALNINRPYSIGDWIGLEEDVKGRVVETNWRSTHILSKTNDLIIIPNSDLAKARLINFTAPDEAHGITIAVRLLPSQTPAVIEETMKSVLLSSNLILKTPRPGVTITGLDASAVEAELSFQVSSIVHAATAKNEIYDLVYRHTKAAGIMLGAPVGASTTDVSPDPILKHTGAARGMLSCVPLLATLTEGEKDTLSASMRQLTFKKDETITTQDASMTSLMIVRSGVVVSERTVDDGPPVELARLAPGDLFGERGVLMGTAETASRRALTFVVVYEISKDILAGVMRERPTLAEELGLLLAKRMEIESHLSHANRHLADDRPTPIADRIRHILEVPYFRHRDNYKSEH